MDNQHRKITGYRELSPDEIALMNEIKLLGNEQILNVVSDVMARVAGQRADTTHMIDPERAEERQRLDAAQPERWIAIARTHFQEGLMALTRAVAQPGFF